MARLSCARNRDRGAGDDELGVLLVVRQIREHQLDLRALAVPVLTVGAAAVMFLHSVPRGGSDVVLDLLCLSGGAAMGAIGGLATHLRAGADGRPLGRAGVLAAGMWITGVGARMVFYFAAGPMRIHSAVSHAQPAIRRPDPGRSRPWRHRYPQRTRAQLPTLAARTEPWT